MLMFAHVTNLRYWKSERADITTCEDASRADPQRGLFCVADGAGTTLFSNIWAEILVEYFVLAPLLGCDPFEMDWWIRQAQKRYRDLVPQADKLNWNARQKAVEQGAYSTLATLRFLRCNERSATAELLVVGDSCVIIGQPDQQTVTAFPLQHAVDFDRAPYCVPALLKNLNRKTLYARQMEVTLTPGTCIILATDAVARWIISGGASGQESMAWYAFQEVACKQTDSTWQAFIDSCRSNQSMVDDDATALIIRLLADGTEGTPLGSHALPQQEIVKTRKAEFEQALTEDNKELVAILYGDGRMLQSTGMTLLSTDAVVHARTVADAMREVLQAMREAIKAANFAQKMEPIWWQYASLLSAEPCTASMRKTLSSQGVRLQQPAARDQDSLQKPPPAQQAPFAQVPTSDFSPGKMHIPAQHVADNGPETARGFSHLPNQPAPLSPEVERLQHFLLEGTPQQKIEAWQALTPQQGLLNISDQLQLDIAQRLLDAFQVNNYARACAAYDEIEALSLRKHFSFTPEDQRMLRAAQDTRSAIKPLRAVLQNDKKSVSLLVDIYQSIHAPQSFLTHEEQRILEVAQAFVRSTHDEQQTIRLNEISPVYLYDELFFSPYHFTFDPQERAQIEQERAIRHLARPPLAQVNQITIDGAQFFALYIVTPLHARAQIRQILDLLSKERSEAARHEHNTHITYWGQRLEPYSLLASTFNELIRQALLEQAISAETEKNRRALEKEIQKILDDLFKEIRAPLDREERKSLISLSEQQWRNALLPYAQSYAFTRHLQAIAPGKTLDDWLNERQRNATIYYYQRPQIHAPTSSDQHECWLFKWWFLRQHSGGLQQGEIEHA
ncbi:MAG TPA: protein phosphatase 2C domain-containing protein [Ktedonobacteraceae bacterium]